MASMSRRASQLVAATTLASVAVITGGSNADADPSGSTGGARPVVRQ